MRIISLRSADLRHATYPLMGFDDPDGPFDASVSCHRPVLVRDGSSPPRRLPFSVLKGLMPGRSERFVQPVRTGSLFEVLHRP